MTANLADRVEGLASPCRETDARVAVACGDIRMSNRPGSIAFFQEPAKKGDYAFLSGCVDGEDEAFRSLGQCLSVKHYTASLDAVVALIEKELPGWGWSVTSRRPGVSYACVTEPEAVVETVRGEASSHALALLAAFLRAKGEQNG